MNLRKADCRHYKTVQTVLRSHSDDAMMNVFSDHIQIFDAALKLTEYIILVTSKFLYLFDLKFVLKRLESIENLEKILLIKTNPSIF